MCVADNFASKQLGDGISKSIATGVKKKLWCEVAQSLPWKVDWAKALADQSKAGIGALFDPPPPQQDYYLFIKHNQSNQWDEQCPPADEVLLETANAIVPNLDI